MSYLKKTLALLRLLRFEHAIMFGISVLIAELISTQGVLTVDSVIIFSLLVPIFSEAGAFAMNDLLDIESDRLNRKNDRPLVTGELTPNFALAVTIFSFLLALAFAYLVSPLIFVLAIIINILAIFYNIMLKDLPLLGNVYIAFTMAIPFIFGNYVVSETINPANLVLALMGFLVGLGREIAKTVEDMQGDKKARKSITLPVVIGSEKSLIIAGILYAMFVIASVVPYYNYLNVGSGFALVLIADAAFLYISVMLMFSRRKVPFLKTARKLSIIALFFGLMGILASVLGY